MKISKYIVISEPNLAKFQQEVQQAIDQNWQPHGSLQVTNENHMIWYSQAMVQVITTAIPKKATTTLSPSTPPASPAPKQAPVGPPLPSPAPDSRSLPVSPAMPTPLAELPPPPTRPPARSKVSVPAPSLAPFPSLSTTAPTPSKPLVATPPSRAKISPRLRTDASKPVDEIPPLSTARPFPASSNFSPQFLWAKNKRYTIFDAVELPGGIAQLSCTVAEGDFERLTLSVGKEAELDEKGRITAKIRIRSVSRRGMMAVIEVSL